MPHLTVLDRPLRLSNAFVNRSLGAAVLFFVTGTALALGAPAWQAFEARKIRADQSLWNRGLEAAHGQVRGSGTTHNFILSSYELDVDYVDGTGAAHRGRAEFNLLFTSLADRAPAEVRYDPQAPDRFALSWAVENSEARWASVAFLGIAGLVMGLVLIHLGRETLRRLAEARQAVLDSEDIEIELAGTVRAKQYGRSTGVITYQYVVSDASGKLKKRKVSFNRRKKHTPIFLDPEKTRVLAVRPRQAADRPIVLRSDFYPFDLREGARQTALARLARARPPE